MSNSQKKCLKVIWRFLVHIPLVIALRGWVVLSYWNWFFVSVGAPSISFWHVLGAYALVTFVTNDISLSAIKLKTAPQTQHGIASDSLSEAFVESVWAILYCLPVMGLGWLYATMM